MRQDFRYSVHMMPNKSNWTLCVYTGRSNNCFFILRQMLSNCEYIKTCKNVKSAEFLQIQNDNKKKKRVAGLDGLKAMTWERGGDDGKLFPSSQSVNYSFRLIRLWSSPPRHPPPPSHHSHFPIWDTEWIDSRKCLFWGTDCGIAVDTVR